MRVLLLEPFWAEQQGFLPGTVAIVTVPMSVSVLRHRCGREKWERGGGYLEISRVALPPTFIWTTPSSHPRRLLAKIQTGAQSS